MFRLTELADYVIPFTIRVACDLGIADLLKEQGQMVEALAGATGTHAASLHRALRALAAKGIFRETEPGRFELTPLAAPMLSDHPLSLRRAYPMLPGEIKAWSEFEHTIRTGGSAFQHVHGQSCWDYLTAHPEEDARWLASQQAATALELRSILSAYRWGDFGTVVDLGGGNGAFLAGLLARHSTMRGVLFDLPHAVARAPELFAEAGVADRCEIVAGSFFDAVPAAADAYVLKRVLYGWDDEQTVAILRQVRAGMKAHSRLLVLEPLVRDGNDDDVGKNYDLLLITMTGGGARTEDQFTSLCTTAGLRVTAVRPTPMLTIVEAEPS